MGESPEDDSDVIIRIGLCAMAKKTSSKPMKEILRRIDKFEHICMIIFEEQVILNEPIEQWPVCDALVSFYSEGFPLKKAIAYSNLRKPYLVNDLESQYILMDRRSVYECLKREGVSVPRYACVDRRPGCSPVNVVESDDSIEINGKVFHKPFVEKPLNAEDHNVYIYFPSSAGGGSQRLFRKVGNLSSKYFSHCSIRTNGSYLYEEFMPTDGTDVKVYTVADDYAHAEARKSPALDGKVERDHEGKEVRYPVILTPREKIIAKKVAKAVQQQICGFDLLRANGMSYVCDVNGFSFVKSSKKYYDDCSHILGVMITRKICPRLCCPISLAFGTDVDTPLVPTTCGTIMELRCVIAVIRHGDRTPKQKMKMEVRHEKFFHLFSKYAGDYTHELKLKRPTQLQEVLDIVREILDEWEQKEDANSPFRKNKTKFEQLKYVLEMYGSFSGINRKIQLKYQPSGSVKNGKVDLTEQLHSGPALDSDPSLLLVVKWGGELTAAGRQQAETLGRAFRCIYPGGDGNYGKDPGLGLLRLHSTYRHDLKIYASDEGRVQMTAAAFAKGFLALEGELPPILVQMVKSANTNGLLDNDNDCRQYQNMVKHRMKEVMTKNTDFTPEDIETLSPTNANSLVNALRYVGNPRSACDRLFTHVKRLGERLLHLAASKKARGAILLYQGESWELLLRRWGKLWKDFRGTGDEYELSKISDIYDNIKYDLQHNPAILLESEAEDFFMCAKFLADIVVPQEYGITREEKLVIGQRICTPLMRKILSDARYTDVDECTRLHAGYSKGVASPERFVRTRLYFTSESHLHSLLTCLRYGDLADITGDEQWQRAMDYVASVPEINYLAQIVIMIYEDPTVEPKTEKRFHVELHFSPGAYALCHDVPEGTGFRPGKLERLNSQASVMSSSMSPGQGSSESVPTQLSSTNMDGNDSEVTTPQCAAMAEKTLGNLEPATVGSHEPQSVERTLTKQSEPIDSGGELTNEALVKLSGISRSRISETSFWNDAVVDNSLSSSSSTSGVCDEADLGTSRRESVSLERDQSDPLADPSECGTNETPDILLRTSTDSIGIGRFLITRSVTEQNTADVPPQLVKSAIALPVSLADDASLAKSGYCSSAAEPLMATPTSETAVHEGRTKCPFGTHPPAGRLAYSCSPNRRTSIMGMPQTNPCSASSNEARWTMGSANACQYQPDVRGFTVSPTNPEQKQPPVPTLSFPRVAELPGSDESAVGSKSALYTTISSTEVALDDLSLVVTAPIPIATTTFNGLATEQKHHYHFDNAKQPPPIQLLQPLIHPAAVPSNRPHHRRHSISSMFPHLRELGIEASDSATLAAQYAILGSRFDLSTVTPLSPDGLPGDSLVRTVGAVAIAGPVNDLPRMDVGALIRTRLSIPSCNTMCDAMLTYAGLLEEQRMEEAEQEAVAAANQALNALTYPSHHSTYTLDIENLVRAAALGAPSPRQFGRSLISTAVIRGSRDDGQASSSVPDIKRLMDDCNFAPRTITPGSSNDFPVPSAPSVPEVYPLETLHNALTLSQLEAFFARLTTHKFPTPFTSPQHPSTPVGYMEHRSEHQHHHHHHHHPYRTDSTVSLNTSRPNTPTLADAVEPFHSEELLTGAPADLSFVDNSIMDPWCGFDVTDKVTKHSIPPVVPPSRSTTEAEDDVEALVDM